MPDLHSRATGKRDELAAVVDDVTAMLEAAQTSLSNRHDDPGAVERSQWGDAFGANQHFAVAAGQLDALMVAEDQMRALLATDGTPADAGTLADELRNNLIEQAELRVEVRRALERQARGKARVDELNKLVQRGRRELMASEQRVAQAEADDEIATTLIDALGASPLDSVSTDADAIRTGAAFTAADDRLDELLPAELRTRASERIEEAAQVIEEAHAHAEAGEAKLHDVVLDANPIEAPIERALAAYLNQRRSLASYVTGARQTIDGAPTVLNRIAAHPDLSDAQHGAVHDDASDESKDAIANEGALAGQLVIARGEARDVEDAIIDALSADLEADVDADATVVAERAELDAAEAAISALPVYDPAAASVWEMDIPNSLWLALADFVAVERELNELQGIDPQTELVAPLESAEQTLADALDTRDDQIRRELTIEALVALRRAERRAVERTRTDRTLHYLRGDGSSGRTPEELVAPTA